MRVIIQEEALRRSEGHYYHHFIHELPTIDAVPVVRCRECKHHKDQLDDRFVICRRWRKIMEVDGFCHKGAKMDGGAEK